MAGANNAQNILLAAGIIDSLLGRIQAWNAAARNASVEGRDMTDDEVAQLRSADDAVDRELVAAIEEKKKRDAASI